MASAWPQSAEACLWALNPYASLAIFTKPREFVSLTIEPCSRPPPSPSWRLTSLIIITQTRNLLLQMVHRDKDGKGASRRPRPAPESSRPSTLTPCLTHGESWFNLARTEFLPVRVGWGIKSVLSSSCVMLLRLRMAAAASAADDSPSFRTAQIFTCRRLAGVLRSRCCFS